MACHGPFSPQPLEFVMSKFFTSLPEDTQYTKLKTPVGDVCLFASHRGLHGLLWDLEIPSRIPHGPQHPVLQSAVQQLREYFAGQRQNFDLPLAPVGTEFQQRVWQVLGEIPFGETISYGEQAMRLGDKKKARAVGTASCLATA